MDTKKFLEFHNDSEYSEEDCMIICDSILHIIREIQSVEYNIFNVFYSSEDNGNFSFFSDGLEIPSRIGIPVLKFSNVIDLFSEEIGYTEDEYIIKISKMMINGITEYYHPFKDEIKHILNKYNILLFNELKSKVKEKIDISIENYTRNYDNGYYDKQSILDRLLDVKDKLDDDGPILGSSIPISLIGSYSDIDCLECWLCNNISEYEYIPIFIWSKNYMYIYNYKSEIKIIDLDRINNRENPLFLGNMGVVPDIIKGIK